MVEISGTEGYADEAEALIARYEAISFSNLHHSVRHLFPTVPARILDIGAGTGRDAAEFAAMGHQVVAAEPTEPLRRKAIELHPSPLIEWLDDSLPDLVELSRRAETFDLVMLTAVWMHLDVDQRQQGMRKVAQLVETGGHLIFFLRHGPVPPGRRMFDVSAEKTIELARPVGLTPVLKLENQKSVTKKPGVTWTRLAFLKN